MAKFARESGVCFFLAEISEFVFLSIFLVFFIFTFFCFDPSALLTFCINFIFDNFDIIGLSL